MVLLLAVLVYMITYIDRILHLDRHAGDPEGIVFSDAVWAPSWPPSTRLCACSRFLAAGWPTVSGRAGCWPRWCCGGRIHGRDLFRLLGQLALQVCLFLFGIGEAGAFPVANRALSRWMLPSERGLAQGATHAGSRLGGAITPILVAALIDFMAGACPSSSSALVGLVWAVVWYLVLSRQSQPSMPASTRPSGKRSTPLWAPHQHAPGRFPGADSFQPPDVDAGGDVFLLRLCLNMFLAWFPKYLDAARGMT